MNNILVKFYWECGRNGAVESIFICTQEELKNIIGKEIYFGEILGKHSEIYGELEEGDFEIKSDDQVFIEKLLVVFNKKTLSGHNPLDYYDPQREEENK